MSKYAQILDIFQYINLSLK